MSWFPRAADPGSLLVTSASGFGTQLSYKPSNVTADPCERVMLGGPLCLALRTDLLCCSACYDPLNCSDLNNLSMACNKNQEVQ